MAIPFGRTRTLAALLGATAAIIISPVQAGTTLTESVLYAFKGGTDGAHPKGPVIFLGTGGGRLAGTTNAGGANGAGTVFGVSLQGKEKLLYSFKSSGGDAANPQGGLRANDKELYGTATAGGAGGNGAVFAVSNISGNESVLYSFPGPGGRGSFPGAGVIFPNASAFYGTTEDGGADGYGTIFSLSKTGTQTVIHSFTNGSDGAKPIAPVYWLQASLFGTTTYGGESSNCPDGCGTAFWVSSSGSYKTIYTFKGGSDGAHPLDSLYYVPTEFYGVTVNGGGSANCPNGCGTVYFVDRYGVEEVVYAFKGGMDGSNPQGGVLMNGGTLYGTTYSGGAYGAGTIFSISNTGVETILHSFSRGADGAHPRGSMILVGGVLYGTTEFGGGSKNCEYGCGTVFAVK
jgi:uncharacterized repeat protein (TIGR03803 family)